MKELERLAADPFVASYRTTDYSQTWWRIYGGLLELSVASALARCGSKKGVDLLADYLYDRLADGKSEPGSFFWVFSLGN